MIYRILFCFIIFYAKLSFATDVYVLKNIKIYGQNVVASEARNQAIEEGQLKAFKALVKLHYPDALSKISSIENDDIFSLVEGYELSDERRSSTDYYAKLKVKFSKPYVNKFMANLGVNYSERTSQNIQAEPQVLDEQQTQAEQPQQPEVKQEFITLAIPVFINNNNEIWFDANNPWLEIWQKNIKGDKFILPVADLEDISLINKNIFHKNVLDLASLYEKYAVNNIAIYTFEVENHENNHLAKFKVSYLNKFLYSWQSYHFPNQQGDDLKQLLEQDFQEAQNLKFDSNLDTCCNITDDFVKTKPQKLVISFEVSNISDWLALEQILKNSSYVTDVQLESVTLNKYVFSNISQISFEDLKKFFSNHGFDLREEKQEFFLIKTEPEGSTETATIGDNIFDQKEENTDED